MRQFILKVYSQNRSKRSIKYFVLLIFFISFVLTSGGCFDVKRDIKFYPNGGGQEKMYITLGKDFFDLLQTYASQDQSGNAKHKLDTLSDNDKLQPKLYDELQKTPNISLKDCIITNKDDGSKEIYIFYTFDEPAAIFKIVNSTLGWAATNPEVIYSSVKFTQEGDDVKFKEIIRNASRAFNDYAGNNLFQSLMMSKMVDQNIEFAFDVNNSNAKPQVEKTCTWEYSIYNAMFNTVEMNADMTKPTGIDLPYAEKVEKVEKVDKNKSPLIRVMVYNANKEWVKTITGIVIKDDELVTSFKLMNLIEGQGYFSVKLNDDSLAGIDDMKENDLDSKLDLCFLRFNNNEKVKPLKYAGWDVTYGQKVKILYYPNTLSSTVYALDGSLTGTKKMSGSTIYEIKPSKPISLEGGAVFNDSGDFMGMITTAYLGEVGKLYIVPAQYIKSKIPK